jgi:hypothetical protein
MSSRPEWTTTGDRGKCQGISRSSSTLHHQISVSSGSQRLGTIGPPLDATTIECERLGGRADGGAAGALAPNFRRRRRPHPPPDHARLDGAPGPRSAAGHRGSRTGTLGQASDAVLTVAAAGGGRPAKAGVIADTECLEPGQEGPAVAHHVVRSGIWRPGELTACRVSGRVSPAALPRRCGSASTRGAFCGEPLPR